MPPAAKRNRCVVLYDLNCKNQDQLRQALFKVYSYQYFTNSKDLVNLVLVNSEKTDNRKHARFGKGYKNICEVNKEPASYDLRSVCKNIETKNSDASNWKEAVRIAIQILEENDIANIITLQILYLTDLSCSVPSGEDLNTLASDLEKFNIFLYIVGPDVKYPSSVTSLKEVHDVMRGLTFIKKNNNLVEANELINEGLNVVISDVKRGLQLFFNYKNPIGKQPWPVPLTFGTRISFPVGTSKFIEKIKGLDLVPKHKTSYQEHVYMSTTNSNLTYHEHDVRRGISRHGKFVPVENNDLFKIKLERTFSLCFITEIKNVPEYMMKGPACYTVVADKKSSQQAFRCLISRLHGNKCCLIVKRVYNKGNKPIYLALIPNFEKNWFRAVQLPYSYEVPFEWRERQPQKSSSAVSTEVTNYLNSITVNGNNSLLSSSLTHNVVSNVHNNKFINHAAAKLLNEHGIHLDQVDYEVFTTELGRGNDLKDIWPSRVADKVIEAVTDYDLDSDYDDAF